MLYCNGTKCIFWLRALAVSGGSVGSRNEKMYYWSLLYCFQCCTVIAHSIESRKIVIYYCIYLYIKLEIASNLNIKQKKLPVSL